MPDATIQVGRDTSQPSGDQPDGVVRSYDAQRRLLRSTIYRDGRIDGWDLRFDPPGEPLFALALDFQAALDAGDIRRLQPAFRQHGHALADDALIVVDLADREWRIVQNERMLSVLRADHGLTIYPGRVAWRAIVADGRLIETAHYRAGWLDGVVTNYGPLGPALLRIDLSVCAALDAGEVGALARLLPQHGHLLASDAIVTTVLEGDEWFMAQAGQSYTIQRSADQLVLFRGRVISQSSYRRGKLDGTTALYDEQGMLAQQIGYRDGLLHGPMTLYAAGVKQTLVTFQHGKKHGPMIAYDKQGRPSMISHYHEDVLDGELRLYKAGSLQAVATYRGGVQHGPTIAYHASGRESLVEEYADGVLDSESVLYSETGQVVKTAQYRQGKLEGAVIEYYPSGAVRTHATYHDDQLDGIVYLYDDQGRLKEKTHYRNGEPVGKPERRSWRQTLTQR
ncbi:MAG TPA: toxin-antitoxin system YwqK family antitoxin [Herpetosiphonaceae bacterium]